MQDNPTATLTLNRKKLGIHLVIGLVIAACAIGFGRLHVPHHYLLALYIFAGIYPFIILCEALLFFINPYEITVNEDGLYIKGFDTVPWNKIASVDYVDNFTSKYSWARLRVDFLATQYQKAPRIQGSWRTKITDDGLALHAVFSISPWLATISPWTIERLARLYMSKNPPTVYQGS